MGGAHASGNGTFSCGKHGGFLLLELLCTIGLIAIATAMMVPVIGNWYEERMLDLAAAEAAAVIRQVEAEARNKRVQYPHASSRLRLYFEMEENRIQYYVIRGPSYKPSSPKGYLAEGVRLTTSNINFPFLKGGIAPETKVYQMHLLSSRGKYRRTIVVQSYTGRVRIE